MQEAIEMATELMDRRINTFAERQAENKRKFEDTPRNNQNQQQNKRQNTGRAYAAGTGDKKPYEGTKPLCPKCNFNHYGPCIPTCNNCKKLGHLAKDCRSRPATANNNNNNNTTGKTYGCYKEPFYHMMFSSFSQNRRDLPMDIPLVSVEVLSHEVLVSAERVEELKRKVKIKGEKKEALLTLRQKS
ncbi:putative reverse transcriptase domain-containing protein, partial [Tanacetum coccineum]